MSVSFSSIPSQYSVLIVDDEPDIHTVTKLSLKNLRFNGQKLELLTATTGKEAVQIIQKQPEIALILLDVVMENDHAGLDACKAIREALGNHFVRIILRTGQPGQAPEKQTIDNYDIDGYLQKAELSGERLYAAVRTGLKAWRELIELERHRNMLGAIHDCVVGIHSFEPLAQSLERILETVVQIAPTSLAVLKLETFEETGNPRQYFLYLAEEKNPVLAEANALEISARINHNTADIASNVDGGYFAPFILHRELGYGWIYLVDVKADALLNKALPMLAAHAANSLYSAVAQAMLVNREGAVFDTMSI